MANTGIPHANTLAGTQSGSAERHQAVARIGQSDQSRVAAQSYGDCGPTPVGDRHWWMERTGQDEEEMKGRVLPFETPNVQSRRVSDCTLQS
jgi:hypothetical protein